jgi:hypothetical protein
MPPFRNLLKPKRSAPAADAPDSAPLGAGLESAAPKEIGPALAGAPDSAPLAGGPGGVAPKEIGPALAGAPDSAPLAGGPGGVAPDEIQPAENKVPIGDPEPPGPRVAAGDPDQHSAVAAETVHRPGHAMDAAKIDPAAVSGDPIPTEHAIVSPAAVRGFDPQPEPPGGEKGVIAITPGEEKGVIAITPGEEKGVIAITPGEEKGVIAITPGEEKGVIAIAPGEDTGIIIDTTPANAFEDDGGSTLLDLSPAAENWVAIRIENVGTPDEPGELDADVGDV